MNNERLQFEANKSIDFLSNHLDGLKRFSFIVDQLKEKQREDGAGSRPNFDILKRLIEINSLITIVHLDLAVALKHMDAAKYKWESIFFIKNIYLLVYEALNTYQKHQKFLSDIATEEAETLKEDFAGAANEIRQFKRNFQYAKKIEVVRNNIAGHISENFNLYYDTVVGFDPEYTAKMCIAFFSVIDRIQKYTNLLIKKEQIYLNEDNRRFEATLQMLKDIGDKLQIVNVEEDLQRIRDVYQNIRMEILKKIKA